MLKKLLTRLLSLVILLIILNFVYSKWFWENDLRVHSDIINQIRELPADVDILYLGESSNITVRYDDKDRRTISEFIGDYFPDLKTCHITKPASHAGIYKILLRRIPRDNTAKTVIVTLNLRSFNADWIYSHLETPLQKSMVLLLDNPPLANRFFLSFKNYDIKSKEEWIELVQEKWESDTFDLPYEFQFKNVKEWDRRMSLTGIGDKNGKYDDIQTILACHYIKAYAFQIDTLSNPRIRDFNEIIKIANDRGWNLVFNLLPENTDKAKEFFGDDLTYFINENVNLITKYFQSKGVQVVNNYNIIRDEQFIDQDWTTEHYAEKGRKMIAKNVAHTIKQWHPDEFGELNEAIPFQAVFYNNCDMGVQWGQMHTITDVLSFSGDYSSFTGSGNDYSLTFEQALKLIPDSLKNKLTIEFMVYQSSLNHDGKLVIQAEGDNIEGFWESYTLKYETETQNRWITFKKNLEIPEVLKNADILKIYFLNTSQENIFIDDFRVTIE